MHGPGGREFYFPSSSRSSHDPNSVFCSFRGQRKIDIFFLVLAGKKESPASRTFPPIFTPHNAKKILGPLVTQVGAPGTFFVSPPPHFCAMSREERRFVACDPSSFFLSFSFLGFCFCLHPPSLAFLRRVFLSIPPPPPCFTTRAGGGGGGGGGGGERNN